MNHHPSSSLLRALAARLLAALTWGLLPALPAQAALLISCSATMTPLTFAPINPLLSNSTIGRATLEYRCRNSLLALVPYSARLCFSIGVPGGGSLHPRLMSSGANRLQFQLYHGDANGSAVWGSQVLGGAYKPVQITFTLGAGQSTSGTIPLLGVVLANQNTTPPGSYTSNYQVGDTMLTVNERIGSTAPPDCASDSGSVERFPFLVSATVEKRCEITAGAASDISLGTVPASASNIPGSGSISVTCTNTTPYNVGLTPSNGNTAGAGTMKASGGGSTDQVPYQLYQDAGMTRSWGKTATDGSVGNGVSGTGTGRATSLSVYVKVPSADVQPDNYSDTVTVNVNY